MLVKDFANIIGGNGRVNRVLSMLEEFGRTLAESDIVVLRFFDHVSKRFEYLRKVVLELCHSMAEVCDLRSLIAKEQFEQMRQSDCIVHSATCHFIAALY